MTSPKGPYSFCAAMLLSVALINVTTLPLPSCATKQLVPLQASSNKPPTPPAPCMEPLKSVPQTKEFKMENVEFKMRIGFHASYTQSFVYSPTYPLVLLVETIFWIRRLM